MRRIRIFRPPRILWQKPKFRVGAAGRLGTVQWYPKKKRRGK